MTNIKVFNAISILCFSFLLANCGISEKPESTTTEPIVLVKEDSTHQNTSKPSSNVSVSKHVFEQGHKEAGLELISPKHMQRVEVGDLHYKFNTEKFPFVNGHSVRLAIEGGVERHIYDSDKKVSIGNKGSYLSVAFLCDKHGISLKGDNTYQLTQLNVGVDEKREINLDQPMIFLNLPHAKEGKFVLIDFFVKNVKIQKGGDRVLVSIDDDTEFYLHEWAPYQIKGLKTGKHHILVELVNAAGVPYEGPYTHDERDLEIQY
jgi:hypothetical protein